MKILIFFFFFFFNDTATTEIYTLSLHDALSISRAPLPTFHFRDLGSLVSLGELSAVGSLMGRLIGGSLLIQGLIARWMYASLYKLHQVAILGYVGVALDNIGRFLSRRTAPRVKLH